MHQIVFAVNSYWWDEHLLKARTFLWFGLFAAFGVHGWLASHANFGLPEKRVLNIGARRCVMGDHFLNPVPQIGNEVPSPFGHYAASGQVNGNTISPSPFLGWANPGRVRWRGSAAFGAVLRLSCLPGNARR